MALLLSLLVVMIGGVVYLSGKVDSLISDSDNIPTSPQIISPTNIPTNAPILTQKELPTPVPQPTKNLLILNRIKQIDEEISRENEQIKFIKAGYKKAQESFDTMEDAPAGVNPLLKIDAQNDLYESNNYRIKQHQNRIDALNAERSQLLPSL